MRLPTPENEVPVNRQTRSLFYRGTKDLSDSNFSSPGINDPSGCAVLPNNALEDPYSPVPEEYKGTDRIGLELFWKSGHIGVVTGFCGTKRKHKTGNKRRKNRLGKSYDPSKDTMQITYWWVKIRDKFIVVKWREKSGRSWLTKPEFVKDKKFQESFRLSLECLKEK